MKTNSREGFLFMVMVLGIAGSSLGAEIERPKVQVVDKFNVNVATGQVTQSMETVRIGGAMGLSHTISVHANELNMLHNFGFNDKFWQETRYVRISSVPGNPIPFVFRVSDFSDSESFRAFVNGNPVLDFRNTPPPYTYVPVGDERHSLMAINDELIWTKPDGTIVKFTWASNAPAGSTGLMKEIVYPNGFTISIAVFGLQSVNTNTGFQLKYLYEADHRPLDKVDIPDLMNAPPPGQTSWQSGWSNRNPRYIKAINNSLECCAPAATTCSLANNWPTATFSWPAAMPRTMFIGDSQATVTDPTGGITKFDFRAYDLWNDEDIHLVPAGIPFRAASEPGRWFSPRLIGVTLPSSAQQTYAYDYKTLFNYSGNEFISWNVRAQTAGVVKTARYMDRSIGYSMLQPFQIGTHRNYGIGGGVNHVLMSSQGTAGSSDVISHADTEDGVVRFEPTARNFATRFEKLSGPWEEYEYTRGNLSKIKVRIDGAWRVHREAGFPASCTAANQKHCNQADWIRDANGNITYFSYHAPSGQIASVTSPPDKHGVSPQTRYEYTQKTARYFNGGASKIDGTPIWLKTAERSCINSSYSGSACAASDEIVTRYEYNHDNLLLTGMTITDLAGAVRRTCFQYDRYGNQIGVTQPKAGLSSCN